MRRPAFALAISLVCAWGRAQSDAGVRLDYQAAAPCAPTPDAFVAQVHGRSTRIQFAQTGARSLAVRITREAPSKLGGHIELREADGSLTERVVTGQTCEDVLAALGLVTAIALDPLAGADTSEPSPEPPRRSRHAGARRADDDDDERRPLEQRTWSFGAGATPEVVLGVTPDPVFAVPVYFEAARAFGAHLALGGGVRFVRTGEPAATSGPGANLTWTAGSLDLCVVVRTGRLRVNLCARGDAGTLDARGEGVSPPRSVTRPWGDVALALAIRLRVAGPFYVEVAGALGVALVRDRFFVEPNTTVFQAPGGVGEAGGGIGFEIW